MYTLTIIQNYIQNLLVFLAKIGLISSNLRQRLSKIDNTAVHRICCSMTNTYNTYLDYNNCYRYKLYQYLHIFHFSPASIFNGGRVEHINFYIPGCTWGINNHNFPIAYTL